MPNGHERNEQRMHIDLHIDGPINVHICGSNSAIIELLKEIDSKLDGLIDSAGDKEKMVALAKEIAAKRAALQGAVNSVPTQTNEGVTP